MNYIFLHTQNGIFSITEHIQGVHIFTNNTIGSFVGTIQDARTYFQGLGYDISRIDIFENDIADTTTPKPRILKFLQGKIFSSYETELFNTLGLIENRTILYGMTRDKSYFDPINNDLVVKENFLDIKDSNGKLLDIAFEIEWYDQYNNVISTVTKLKNYGLIWARGEAINRRRNCIVELLSESESETPMQAQYVSQLLVQMKDEINLFYDMGGDGLGNSITTLKDSGAYDSIFLASANNGLGENIYQAIMRKINEVKNL